MADVATLGLQVNSAPVVQGTAALNNLSNAATKAQAANNNLGNSSRSAGSAMTTAGTSARTAAAGFQTAGAAAVAAANQVNQLRNAANQNARVMGGSITPVGNLAAQFQDIGVSAQMGMSPLQIALQQGTQISAVLGPMGAAGAVRSLGTAFLSIISPVAIVTIAIVALIAAVIQFVDWGKLIGSMLELLADALEGVVPAVNTLIGAFVGAYRYILSVWSNLPTALSGIAKQAVNEMIASMEEPLLKIQGGLLGKLFGNQTLIGGLDLSGFKMDLTAAEKGAMDSANAAFGSAMNQDYLGSFGTSIQSAADKGAAGLRNLAKWMTTVEEKKKKGKSDADKYADILQGGQGRLSSLQAEQAGLMLTAEAAAKLRYETEMLNAAREQELKLSPEQRAELSALAGQMAATEAATTKAKEAMEFSKSSFKSFIDDVRSGMEAGAGFWRSFGDAALNVLDRITDKLLNEVLDALFQVNSAAGGGGGGFLQSVLGFLGGGMGGGTGNAIIVGPNMGFAKGAAFNAGNVVPFARGAVVSRPTLFPMAGGAGLMAEAGPEAVMPLRRGRGGRLGVEMSGGMGMPQMVFSPVIDARGADVAAVARLQAVVQTMSAEFQARVEEAVIKARKSRTL